MLKKIKTRWGVVLFICVLIVSACERNKTTAIDHPAQVDNIIKNADSLMNDGQLKESIIYLDSAYRGIAQPGPGDLWKKYKQKLTYYLNYDVQPLTAKIYVDSMTLVIQDRMTDYKELHALTFFAIGDLYMAEKKYTEAFKAYYDGRTFAKENLDTCTYSQFSNKLGLVKFKQGKYMEALPLLKASIAENQQCNAKSGFLYSYYFPQSTYNTIALCYEQAGRPDSAIFYYHKGIEFVKQQSKLFPDKQHFTMTALGVFYGNIGGTYAKLDNFKEAERFLKQSVEINNRPGYAQEDAQTAKLKLIDLYLRQNLYEKAEISLNRLESNLSLWKGKDQERNNIWLQWYKLKSDYFNGTDQDSQAYQYLQKYIALKDSLDIVLGGLKSADMNAAFQNTEQQYSLAILTKNSEIKTAYLIFTIIFSILILAILISVRLNLNRSKRHISVLTGLHNQVTEQNIQMQQALSSLEQSQADNTRMMKIVAHDLRNPISAIKMATQLIAQNPGNWAANIRIIKIITRSTDNAFELVNELLQTQSKREEIIKESIDLQAMVQYCADLLKHKATAKKQRINLNTIPLTLFGSREKLWRVVSNLIANAIKFSPNDAEIDVSIQQYEKYVCIAVKDHGIGIPEEIKDKIFDMFTEAKRLGTAGEQPFGLGLAISKQIVEAHGGRIWFESEPIKGTTFFVELPI